MEQDKFKIFPIPALQDNYIWCIFNPNNNKAVIVDPGAHEPVISALTQRNLELQAILITHHHWDHTGGIQGLLDKWQASIYQTKNVTEGELCDFPDINLQLNVLEIPGHTLDHIAFYGNGILFCGDTLFTGGCGRIFEGTAAQMLASLKKLMSLPEETLVYCAHEYTVNNLDFAQLVEPNNQQLQQRILATKKLISMQQPTIPSTLAIEIATNPFLRTSEDTIIKAVEQHYGKRFQSESELFEKLRNWKNFL